MKDMFKEIFSMILGLAASLVAAIVMLFTIFDPLTLWFDHGRTDEPVSSAFGAFFVICAIALAIGFVVMFFLNPTPIDIDEIFDEDKVKIRKHRAKIQRQLALEEEYERSNEFLDQIDIDTDLYEYVNGSMSDTERKSLYQLLKVDMN